MPLILVSQTQFTSAMIMNGVSVAYGLVVAGNETARMGREQCYR